MPSFAIQVNIFALDDFYYDVWVYYYGDDGLEGRGPFRLRSGESSTIEFSSDSDPEYFNFFAIAPVGCDLQGCEDGFSYAEIAMKTDSEDEPVATVSAVNVQFMRVTEGDASFPKKWNPAFGDVTIKNSDGDVVLETELKQITGRAGLLFLEPSEVESLSVDSYTVEFENYPYYTYSFQITDPPQFITGSNYITGD